MAPPISRKKSSKNPPILSHEFVIQNHGDIVSCITMVAVAGLFLEATSPVAMMFISLQHNVTIQTAESTRTAYEHGWKDLCTICFYSLVFVVAHAIIQEYLLDKVNRRMHLSRTKHILFDESAHLCISSIATVALAVYVLIKDEGFWSSGLSGLWQEYPGVRMSFWLKMWVMLQLAYWCHCFLELYFQKVKKEDMFRRVKMYSAYLIIISAAYLLHLKLLLLLLLTLHHTAEALYHFSKLFHFADQHTIAILSFKLWKGVFVVVRLITITLSLIVVWFGMAKESVPEVDWQQGNFNTPHFRMTVLGVVLLSQAVMMWHFITFHVRKVREGRHDDDASSTTTAASATAATSATSAAGAAGADGVVSKVGKNKKATKGAEGDDETQENGGSRYRFKQSLKNSK